MKMKFIACAVAAVCAQSAFALDFATTKSIQNGTLANSHAVYLSGASALRASVPGALAKLCSDTVDTYQFSGDTSNVKAYSCTIKSVAGLAAAGVTGLDTWATHKLLMGLSVQTGSLSAVLSQDAAVANQNQQIDFILGTNAAGTVNAAIKKQTIGGFLDVNPEMFSDVLSLIPGLNVSYTTTPIAAGQSFGVGVSPSLYLALQNAQGLGGACAGLRTVACQPSISKGQYASLIASANAGLITDWSVLGLSDAQPVNICRRVATSGTQAASNLFFLGKGCSSGALEPATAGESNPGVYNVTEGSGSGNVVTCLSNASNFAMGVISAENASASSVWKFVKLDGVAINDTSEVVPGKARQTAIDQKYAFTYEFVIATRNSAPAVEQSFLAALGTVIADPAVTNLNGIYASPANAAFISNAAAPTQVAKATSGGNVCQAPLTYF